jgi:hypothetical protein
MIDRKEEKRVINGNFWGKFLLRGKIFGTWKFLLILIENLHINKRECRSGIYANFSKQKNFPSFFRSLVHI